MNTTTRLARTITGSGVKELVGLSVEQLKTLNEDYLVTLLQNLAFLDKEDVDELLGNNMSTFLVGRKILMVASFLRKERTLSSTTTMSAVMLWSGASQSKSSTMVSKSTAPIRLLPTDFSSFNGDIEEQK
eukprot:4854577-Ditylum_brightwellii.AAC.1